MYVLFLLDYYYLLERKYFSFARVFGILIVILTLVYGSVSVATSCTNYRIMLIIQIKTIM